MQCFYFDLFFIVCLILIKIKKINALTIVKVKSTTNFRKTTN